MDDFVSWDASYDLGIEYVDKQHRRLVELINELYHACLGEKGELEEKFKHVMKELVEYVMIHFKDEEKIMEEINYPNIKDYRNGKQFVPNTFVRFLRDWLFNHILISDKEWAKFYFANKK